jgi:hypothetical protein
MTVGEQAGSMSGAYSVSPSFLSVMTRGNMPGTGSAPVTVHGASLGFVAYTGRGRVGQTGCEATDWESETSVRCMVGRGVQGTRRVAMTAGERVGSGSAAYSVDVGAVSVSRGYNRAGTGSASMTVHGSGMGLVNMTYTERDDDGRGAGRKCDGRVVGGRGGRAERGAGTEPGGDRVGVGDGARIGDGACEYDVHANGAVWSDGVRGNGVGVGDVGEVHGGARGEGHAARDDDGRGAGRKHVGGILGEP